MAFGVILNQQDWYTKSQTISDQTKLLLGLTTDATPDEAFLALYFHDRSMNLFGVTITYPNGDPWPNLQLQGVTNVNGDSISTDENGYALCASESATPTLTASSGYIDINNISWQLDKDASFITPVSIQASYVTPYVRINNSRQITKDQIFKTANTIDITVVGGGAGGSYGYSNNAGEDSWFGGGGGGGGYVTTQLGININSINDYIDITIGSGGLGGIYTGSSEREPSSGNSTIVKDSSSQINITAKGGGSPRVTTPGTGNGNGGQGGEDTYQSPTDGSDGTGYIFNEFSLGVAGGGGGGGGYCDNNRPSGGSGGAGGSPYGGKGGNYSSDGQAGRGPGGGGGGGGVGNHSYGYGKHAYGGNGSAGTVYIRFNHS